jgi:hypothetical protein
MTAPLVDYHELVELTADLGKVNGLAVKAVTAAALENGETLRALWAAGVASTAPVHLPDLPAAITVEPKFSIGSLGVEVGPEMGRKQGAFGKGDEYGSVNTPPHMHGHRSADMIEPVFVKAVEAAALSAMSPVTRG